MSKYSLSLQREEEIKGERKSETRILDWEVKNEKPSPNRVSYRLKLLNRRTKKRNQKRILDWEVKKEKPSPNRVSYRLKLLNMY